MDTSELHETREALDATNQRLTTILQSITDGIIVLDPAYCLLYLNQQAEAIIRPLDKPAATQLGSDFWEQFPELLGTPLEQSFRQAVAGQHTVQIELHHQRLQSWLEVRCYPSTEGLTVYFQDITRRKQQEQALRDSTERLQLAFYAGHLGDWSWDAQSDRVSLGVLAANIFGVPPDTRVTRQQILDLLHEEDRTRARVVFERAIADRKNYSIEYRVNRPGEGWYWIAVEGRARYGPDGAVLGMNGVVQDITERKRAEEELRRSELFNRSILDSSRDCITLLDLAGVMVRMSESGQKMLGITDIQPYLNRSWMDLWQDKEREAARAAIKHAAAGRSGSFVGFCATTDGTPKWWDVLVTPILDTRGAPEKLLAVARDVTERRQAEQDLESRERALSLIYGNVSDVIFYISVETPEAATGDADHLYRFISVNPAFLAATGLQREQVIGRRVDEVIPEPSCRVVLDHYSRAVRTRDTVRWEETTSYPSGTKVGAVSVTPIFDKNGLCISLIGTVHDVTDRKHAEEQLRKSEAELRALADSIPQLAWMAAPDGNIFWFNRGWYDYTGTSLDQMQGWGWSAMHHPELRESVRARWQESVRTGEPFEMEFPIRGRDGIHRWFLTRVNPMRDEHGRVIRWFGTNTDVDQVKRMQEALQDETRILELLNKTGATLAAKLDLRTLLQEVTEAATQLSGAKFGAFFYNTTDEKGDAFMLYTLSGAPRDAFEKFGHPRATPLFGPTFRGEGPIRLDDVMADPRYGQWDPHFGMPKAHLPVRSYLAIPVASRSGEVIGGLFFGHPETGVFTERTERIIVGVAAQAAIAVDNARLYEAAQKTTEEREQLLDSERAARTEAERMSELKDEFLATLSHELRTPLSAILGWSQLLKQGARTEAELRKGLDTIERNARVQTQLIEDLLDMSRITSGKVRLDVQQLEPIAFIEAAAETVRPAADAKGVTLEKILDPAAGPISGDPGRLQQIVWNLLSNAIKFTPRDGTVTIELARVDSYVEINVTDTGIGIKPEFLPHVFERFRQADASTTRRYGGLGLGLSIVKHLVELHGGSVSVSSRGIDRGSAFQVRLPLSSTQRRTSGELRAGLHLPRTMSGNFKTLDLSGIKILVVDDTADARELLRRVLGECNAEVLTAGNAAEALALIEHEKPHVLVSDIGMPDVDGFELLKQVRALGPARGGKLPAIALTAFARTEDRARTMQAGFLAHIAKPVEPGELVATVASIAGRSREPR